MIKAHVTGTYRSFSFSTIALIAFALIYFIAPADLIPDFVPALGFSDDISVVILIFKKISKDVEKFTKWEQGGTSTKAEFSDQPT